MSKPDFWEGYVPEPVKPAPVTKDAALKLALEALEHMLEDAKQERLTVEYWNECVDAITAIKQALAAQRQWVGLTDEERNYARQTVTYSQLAMTAGEWAEKVQIETERRLKEKNT